MSGASLPAANVGQHSTLPADDGKIFLVTYGCVDSADLLGIQKAVALSHNRPTYRLQATRHCHHRRKKADT